MIICFRFCFNFAFKLKLRRYNKGVHEHTAKLAETSDFASREWSFEKTLDKMIKDWEGVLFVLKPWKQTGTFILEAGAYTRPLLSST
jgi:hypothetical protein